MIYFRVAGPASEPIRTGDDWTKLLERCLAHRVDLLANIMHRALATSEKPVENVTELLHAACNSTADDYVSQVNETDIPAPDASWFKLKALGFFVGSYALVGNDGRSIVIQDAYGLNQAIEIDLRTNYRLKSWTPFRAVRAPERAPQVRSGSLLGQEVSYLEGMRLPAMRIAEGADDYWRIYESGIVTIAMAYREDRVNYHTGSTRPYLEVDECLAKVHAVLAHARLVARELPSVAQIIFRADWRGLKGRELGWNKDTIVTGKKLVDDRSAYNITISWSELRESYFEALRKAIFPLFRLFDMPGYPDTQKWLNRDLVVDQFLNLDPELKLFD